MHSARVKEILSWHGADNPGSLTNLARLQARGIQEGGGFGAIMGRNAFQRKEKHAIKLLGQSMDIYAAK